MVVAAYPLALFLLGIVLLFLIMVNQGYQYTFGALLQWLAEQFRRVRTPGWLGGDHVLGFIADGIDAADGAILHTLGAGILTIEKAVLGMWGNMIVTIQEIGSTVGDLAHETGRALHVLRHSTIAKVALGVLGFAPSLIFQHSRQIKQLLADPGTKLQAQAIAKLRASVGAIAIPRPHLGPTIADWTQIKSRLKKVEKLATIAGISGLVLGVLSKVGIGHLTEPQCKTNTKQLCAAHPDWLQQLLLGGLTVFGGLSLVRLAEYEKPLVAEAGTLVTHFWRADVKGLGADPAFGSGSVTPLRNPGFGEA